jgi:hypothetical protein
MSLPLVSSIAEFYIDMRRAIRFIVFFLWWYRAGLRYPIWLVSPEFP